MRRWPVLIYVAGMGTLYLLWALADGLAGLRPSDALPLALPLWAPVLGLLAVGILVGSAYRSIWGTVCFLGAATLLAALSYTSGNEAGLALHGASLALLAVVAMVSALRRI